MQIIYCGDLPEFIDIVAGLTKQCLAFEAYATELKIVITGY